MNIKKCKDAAKIARSYELNEGDPIYVETKTEAGTLYKHFGRYIEVPEFRNNCLSKDLRIITQEALTFFEDGVLKFADFTVIKGTKKIWLLSEKDIKEDYSKGMSPQNYKNWRKIQK